MNEGSDQTGQTGNFIGFCQTMAINKGYNLGEFRSFSRSLICIFKISFFCLVIAMSVRPSAPCGDYAWSMLTANSLTQQHLEIFDNMSEARETAYCLQHLEIFSVI